MKTYTINNSAGRDNACAAITELDPAKQWTVTIEPYRKRRSTSANNLYWAWVTEVANAVSDYTGYEKDEIHGYFKQRFLAEPYAKKVKIGDDAPYWHYSTANLDSAAMAEYMNRIYRFATTDLGLTLPVPPTAEKRG